MTDPIDPQGRRLPIKLDSASNGEFVPVPLSPANRAANRLAHENASACARKLGLSRRKFSRESAISKQVASVGATRPSHTPLSGRGRNLDFPRPSLPSCWEYRCAPSKTGSKDGVSPMRPRKP